MSQADDIRTLVKARIQQAQNALDASQILLKQGFYSDSINRADSLKLARQSTEG